jgi:hydrogenase maturation protein HypF
MIERRFQTVDTSSCGRLFDAVSALLGVCLESRYEAEAAMELEAIADDNSAAFGFELSNGEIDLRETFHALIAGLRHGDSVGSLAARFHNTLAQAIVTACQEVRRADGLRRVCLSGGSFQNMRLLEATVAGLERAGFEVYWHSEVPPNDGGLSLGQAAIACATVER